MLETTPTTTTSRKTNLSEYSRLEDSYFKTTKQQTLPIILLQAIVLLEYVSSCKEETTRLKKKLIRIGSNNPITKVHSTECRQQNDEFLDSSLARRIFPAFCEDAGVGGGGRDSNQKKMLRNVWTFPFKRVGNLL